MTQTKLVFALVVRLGCVMGIFEISCRDFLLSPQTVQVNQISFAVLNPIKPCEPEDVLKHDLVEMWIRRLSSHTLTAVSLSSVEIFRVLLLISLVTCS